MSACLEVPNELISRARSAGINCSAIARNAIADAVRKLEPKETGESSGQAQTSPAATPKGGQV